MRITIALIALVGALAAVTPVHAQSDVARWPQVTGVFLISPTKSPHRHTRIPQTR